MIFCMKFNSQQRVFEQFFYIGGNLGSIQPENESTFQFQYNYNVPRCPRIIINKSKFWSITPTFFFSLIIFNISTLHL